jgi:predicted naringenin-chalcone synthase
MSLDILGIGTAVPDHSIAQRDAAGLAVGFANAAPGREQTLAALYRMTGIRSRGSVLLDPPAGQPFAQDFFPPADLEAGPLAIAAASQALALSATPATAITHLVTCSCTGFASPGVDVELIDALGLPSDVARTQVGFMGCHGAFNALRVADALAGTAQTAQVLVVCVELCSLHFQYGTLSDHVIANSLFADGAAAAVGRAPDPAGPASNHPGPRQPTWRLARQASRLLPDSRRAMGWLVGDTGFEMSLSAKVPDLIAAHLPGAVDGFLASAGLTRDAVVGWGVHPGGPRILSAVEESLELQPAALADSRGVLADHGNMSSATVLFVLDRLRARPAPSPALAMAFGPGLTLELALFTDGIPNDS